MGGRLIGEDDVPPTQLAGVAELVDAPDSSPGARKACGFDSHHPHSVRGRPGR